MIFGKVRSYLMFCKKKRKWRQQNRHNNTYIINDFRFENVLVGNATYGGLTVINFGKNERLIIGNYCSIASGVVFVLNGEHAIDTVSSFPFKNKILKTDASEALSKGNIVIDDDVWIGQNAIILSGVHVYQGAVIAAGAVVSHDVPPYAIVGGVPARIIRYRFDDEIIKKLINIDYSKIDYDFVRNHSDILYLTVDDKYPFDIFPKKCADK